MALTNCDNCGHGHVCHLTPAEQERVDVVQLVANVVREFGDGYMDGRRGMERIRFLLRDAGVLPPPAPRPPVRARRRPPIPSIESNPALPIPANPVLPMPQGWSVELRGGAGGGRGVPVSVPNGGGGGAAVTGSPGITLDSIIQSMPSLDEWVDHMEARDREGDAARAAIIQRYAIDSGRRVRRDL